MDIWFWLQLALLLLIFSFVTAIVVGAILVHVLNQLMANLGVGGGKAAKDPMGAMLQHFAMGAIKDLTDDGDEK